MDGYVTTGLRRKRPFQCAVGNGMTQKHVKEVAAIDKVDAEAEYRKLMGKAVHPLDGVIIVELPEK